MKVLITVKEAADLLKVKPQWVYRMMRSDGLPCIRLGRQVRIDEDSLEKWLAEHRSDAD
jgi:excisionase family DNA binding protein